MQPSSCVPFQVRQYKGWASTSVLAQLNQRIRASTHCVPAQMGQCNTCASTSRPAQHVCQHIQTSSTCMSAHSDQLKKYAGSCVQAHLLY
jgi:hypothetical protein